MNPQNYFLSRIDHKKVLEQVGSLQLRAHSHGKLVIDMQLGRKYKYYDIASLTKIVFTTSAFMNLDSPPLMQKSLQSFFANSDLGTTLQNLTLCDLLSHRAGVPWWVSLEKWSLTGNWQKRRMSLRDYLFDTKVKKNGQTVYSDVDMMILGFVIEEAYNKNLLEVWKSLSHKYGMKHTHFQVGNKIKYKRKDYAPTQAFSDKCLRSQGLVNDFNTRELLGVSSHAGLFSTIDDLSQWGLLWRKSLRNIRGGLCKASTAQYFSRRSFSKSGDFALGFMLPDAKTPSCGLKFSKSSTGHTAFTGPSIWYDPRQDLLVSILANKKYPDRVEDFKKLRPYLHDLVVDAVSSKR